MSGRSRVGFDEREYRETSRRRDDDVAVRILERERDRESDRLPTFLREQRRPEPGPLVLRQRDIETTERRRRSPSPVRVRETRIVRARSVSPVPQRRTEEDVRFRTIERVREPSRGPDLERLRSRIVRPRSRSRSSSRSSSDESSSRVRASIFHRHRSPSPVRERIRIVEREKQRPRSPSPRPAPPPPPQVIKGPIVEREVITHYTDIDHGVIQARPPPPPPPIRQRDRETDIDIYTSRHETEVDIHQHSSRSRSRARSRARSRVRSISRERVSPGHMHVHDDGVMVHASNKHLHVDVEAHRSHSHSLSRRRAHSAAPLYHEYDDEAREITTKIDSRGKMGEAYNGITRDWTIVDVPPGTERVRMDGVGGAAAEVTWQKYSGVRRSRFIPDDKSMAMSSTTSLSDREVRNHGRDSRLSISIYDKDGRDREEVSDRRLSIRRDQSPAPPRRSEMWTEITKDLVLREAIEELGYEFEETEFFFYVMTYLRYEDVLQLVQLSDAVRRARKDRVKEIQWEREYRDEMDREYRYHHHHQGHSRSRSKYDNETTVDVSYEHNHRGSRGYH